MNRAMLRCSSEAALTRYGLLALGLLAGCFGYGQIIGEPPMAPLRCPNCCGWQPRSGLGCYSRWCCIGMPRCLQFLDWLNHWVIQGKGLLSTEGVVTVPLHLQQAQALVSSLP